MDCDEFDDDWNEGGFDPFRELVEPDERITDNLVVGDGQLTEALPTSFLDEHPISELPEPIIQNVIASVNLSTELNLRLIAISARNAEYNPTKVNAVVCDNQQ